MENISADVVIVGAGVIGSAIARELSRYQLNIVLLEKEADVAMGTSKANSAIVHAGFDNKPGTLAAKLNVEGNALFDQVSEELDVPFRRVGALVVATNEEEVKILQELKTRGEANGVPGLRIMTREEVREKEPNVAEGVIAALYAPSSGIVCPFHLTIGYAENAVVNGVKLMLETAVEGLEIEKGKVTGVVTNKGRIRTRYVINAAGVFSDDIARMVGDDYVQVSPRKGQYFLLDKKAGNTVTSTIFPTPTKMGKGILISQTVDGNLLLGPTAEDQLDKEDVSTTSEGLAWVLDKVNLMIQNVSPRDAITTYSGLRAQPSTGDFVIEPSRNVKGLIHAAGIKSPGLASSPAIAKMVVNLIKEAEGNNLVEKSDFQPQRKVVRFHTLSPEEQAKIVEENPQYGRIICRCETVTEGEIVDAIRRPVGAPNLDGIKRRTRAGAGRCQGGFCSPRVVAILSRELGIPMEQVTKFGGNSVLLYGKTKSMLTGEEGPKC